MEDYVKTKDWLVCVDSDGCVIDSMDIKHINCFGPCVITEWGLGRWRDHLLDRWNVMNLYSMTRGINRFTGLARILEEVNATLIRIDGIKDFASWVDSAPELSLRAVEKQYAVTGLPIYAKAVRWSKSVNECINALPKEDIKPFEGAAEGITAAREQANIAVVSSANPEAVKEEWTRYGLLDKVDICLTQEKGTKAACIKMMLGYGYAPDHILMTGDAPGDLAAAQKNGVLYFPILAKRESESWKEFKETALGKFFSGSYKGEYQQQRIEAFENNLKGE